MSAVPGQAAFKPRAASGLAASMLCYQFSSGTGVGDQQVAEPP